MEVVFICITVFLTVTLFSILQDPAASFMQRYQYKKFLKVEDYYRDITVQKNFIMWALRKKKKCPY
jgi:hypothetical protein